MPSVLAVSQVTVSPPPVDDDELSGHLAQAQGPLAKRCYPDAKLYTDALCQAAPTATLCGS